jgi:hypothetical protein
MCRYAVHPSSARAIFARRDLTVAAKMVPSQKSILYIVTGIFADAPAIQPWRIVVTIPLLAPRPRCLQKVQRISQAKLSVALAFPKTAVVATSEWSPNCISLNAPASGHRSNT